MKLQMGSLIIVTMMAFQMCQMFDGGNSGDAGGDDNGTFSSDDDGFEVVSAVVGDGFEVISTVVGLSTNISGRISPGSEETLLGTPKPARSAKIKGTSSSENKSRQRSKSDEGRAVEQSAINWFQLGGSAPDLRKETVLKESSKAT